MTLRNLTPARAETLVLIQQGLVRAEQRAGHPRIIGAHAPTVNWLLHHGYAEHGPVPGRGFRRKAALQLTAKGHALFTDLDRERGELIALRETDPILRAIDIG